MEEDSLEARLAAVERALTDEASTISPPATEDRLDDLEDRIRELEAATQALRGYVGDVRVRDDRTEHRTDPALADVKRRRISHRDLEVDSHHPTGRASHPPGDGPDADPGMMDRLAAWL
jgi:hypothetical protein